MLLRGGDKSCGYAHQVEELLVGANQPDGSVFHRVRDQHFDVRCRQFFQLLDVAVHPFGEGLRASPWGPRI